ncbi:TonB-dependent receptor [Sphingobacterium paludis]|uniref:Iron complex outermembrane receptor protein n=1 Tax=Sphingobacterium paludis TaxID=1476465 RepID=A0A4R7CZI0_9SPHI|nr:TonB-dependent receptor [Sphingobacterium paludis]TDS13171.1 iron complex outermembrane receptor protein [Sphingobacterium paludis]
MFKRAYIAILPVFFFYLTSTSTPLLAITPSDTLRSIKIDSAVVLGTVSPFGSVTKISRTALDHIQSGTLGETLGHLPGVQNVYFGPSAGAPMIRSLSGNRVRVLQNGQPINDLSGISPNININVDMDNMREVELYKGSAAVLYGGKAIGGAVNLKDNTIPHRRFAKKLQGTAQLELGTNSGSRQVVQLAGNLGDRWSWYVGGTNQRHGDLHIPGNTKAAFAYDPSIDHLTADMAQVHVHRENIRNLSLYPYISQFVLDNQSNPAWGLSEADLYTFEKFSSIGGQLVANPANEKYIAGQDPTTPLYTTVVHGITDFHPVTYGVMPNSHANARFVNLGSSYIQDSLRIGIGYRAMEGYYGVPGFAVASKPKHSHEPVEQSADYQPINTRAMAHSIQLESVLKPGSIVLPEFSIQYALQYADDRELVGIYRVNTMESYRHGLRMEGKHQVGQYWSGMHGVELAHLKLEGNGVRRYLPRNLSREIGLFTTHSFSWKRLSLDMGYRHDQVARRVLIDKQYKPSRGLAGGTHAARDFALNQFSADLRYNLLNFAFVKAGLLQSERAPEVNELYAGNEHFAILVEENGDDRLNRERARGYELAVGTQVKGLRIQATHYLTNFYDYLYLAHTGISRSGGFLVKEWRASDTRVTGWELEALYQLTWQTDQRVEVSGFADLVKNSNRSEDHLRRWAEGDFMPNLPTSRYGGALTINYRRFFIHAMVEHYLKQRFLGKNINLERPMPAYALLRAQLGYDFQIMGRNVTCSLDGQNLLNQEARPQNSILKYLAPLPGRNITLGLKCYL